MKFMEKAKRFFTLKRRANDGFTLVELIVVIAILAILAGVAVPAYSGYIEKSKVAGDETLLAAVNKAFASACVAGGSDIWLVTNADVTITNKKVTGISFVSGADADTLATMNEAFKLFYVDENPTAQFEVYADLGFDATKHVFVGLKEGQVIENVKNAINGSSYKGYIPEMTEQVGGLVNSLVDYLGGEGADALDGSGFGEYVNDVLKLEEDEQTPEAMANAAVLYLAHSAAGMTETNINNAKETMALALETYLTEGKITDALIKDLSPDTNSGLAGYAMLYATAEALALQAKEAGDSTAYDALTGVNITDAGSVLTAVNGAFSAMEFNDIVTYIVPDEAGNSGLNTDMDAYFQTMQALNTKEDALKGNLSSGTIITEDATIKDLLAQLQGK